MKRKLIAVILCLAIALASVNTSDIKAAVNVVNSNYIDLCEPYTINGGNIVDELEMGGNIYKNAIRFEWTWGYYWGSRYANFNLEEKYKSISFEVGRIGGTDDDKQNATLIVRTDGVEAVKETINPNAIPRKYTINVEGVTQFDIEIQKNSGYTSYYGIGAINLVENSEMELDEDKYSSNFVDNCEPYNKSDGVSIVDELTMGGNVYKGAIKMNWTWGYYWGSRQVNFNLGGNYKKFSFDIGRIGGSSDDCVNATLVVRLDQEEIINEIIDPKAAPKKINIDVTNGHQLDIELKKASGYTSYYGIGAIKLISDKTIELPKQNVYKNSDDIKVCGKVKFSSEVSSTDFQTFVDSIVCKSDNENIIRSKDITCVGGGSDDGKSFDLFIKALPLREGNTTIHVKSADGKVSAQCELIIEPALMILSQTDITDTSTIICTAFVSESDPDYIGDFMNKVSVEVKGDSELNPIIKSKTVKVLEDGYGAEIEVKLLISDEEIEKENYELIFKSENGQKINATGELRGDQGFFRIKKDTNSFSHSAVGVSHDNDRTEKIGSHFVMSPEYYSRAVSGLSWNDEVMILNEINSEEEWHGSCFGLSVSTILGYSGGFDVDSFGSEDGKYYSLVSPAQNEKLRDAINMYHIMQYRNDCNDTKIVYNDHFKNFSKWLVTDENILYNSNAFWRDFFDAVENNINSKKPMILSFGYKNTGHSVVVCGIDKVNGGTRIKIYDVNSISEYMYLFVSEDFKEFFITNDVQLNDSEKYYVTNENWTYLAYSDWDVLSKIQTLGGLDNKNEKNTKLRSTQLFSVDEMSTNKTQIIVSAFEEFYAENDKGEYLGFDSDGYYGNMNIYNVQLVGDEKQQKLVFTVDDAECFNVKDFSEKFYFATCINDKSFIVNKTSAESFGIGDALTFEGEDFEFSSATANSDINIINISGRGNGKIEVMNNDGAVSAKSDENITSCKVSLYTPEKNEVFSDINDTNLIAISVNDGKVEVGDDIVLPTATPVATEASSTEEPSITPTPSVQNVPTENPTKKPVVTSVPTETPHGTALPTIKPIDKSTSSSTSNETVTSAGSTKTDNLAKGYKYIDSKTKLVYIIASKGKAATVVCKGTQDKKATTITIPAKIKIAGKSYKVISVASSAFKNKRKLKKITIGKNIEAIGKNAFMGCKNLKTINFKSSKINSKGIKNGTFAGLSKKVVINVPKKKLKIYKKLFKGKGFKGKLKRRC